MVVQFSVFLNLSTLICWGTDILKCFSESLGIRDNKSRLYLRGTGTFSRHEIVPKRFASLLKLDILFMERTFSRLKTFSPFIVDPCTEGTCCARRQTRNPKSRLFFYKIAENLQRTFIYLDMRKRKIYVGLSVTWLSADGKMTFCVFRIQWISSKHSLQRHHRLSKALPLKCFLLQRLYHEQNGM